MADETSYKLSLELDRQDRTYRAGETISGRVRTEVSSGYPCKELIVELYYVARGSGDQDREDVEKKTLYSGFMKPDRIQTHGFSFELPDAPHTFAGSQVNIEWYIRAELSKSSWRFDASCEETIQVLAPQDHRPVVRSETPFDPDEQPMGFGGRMLMELIMLAVAAALAYWVVWPLFDSGWWKLSLGGAIVVLAIVLVVLADFKRLVAEAKTGRVRVEVLPAQAEDEYLTVRVHYQPSRRARLNGAMANLVVKEEAISGSISERSVYTEQLHTSGRAMRRSTENPNVMEARLKLPDTRPLSFKGGHNSIAWVLTVHIDVEGWPDWKDETTLVVQPSGR